VARGRRVTVLFLDRNALQINEAGHFSVRWMRSRGFNTFFAWQNRFDYRQCLLIKAPIFWQK
jgi:hypothetical protein